MLRRPALSLCAAALALGGVVALAQLPDPPSRFQTEGAPEPSPSVTDPLPNPPLPSRSVATTTTTTAPPPPPTTAPPAPPATLAPPQTISSGDCRGWAPTIAAHFPAEQRAKACSVMLCESSGNPSIANEQGSGASGLWQFIGSTWTSTTGLAPPASAYSPDQQTAAAAALWRSSGWSPWACA